MIHSLSDVQSQNIGEGTTIWQYAVVLKEAIIGRNCNINCHTFIENNVIIGNNVTVKSGIYIWDNIVIEDDVFLGPNVVFTNDLRPRSKQRVDYLPTKVCKGASIGANATILAGVTIGEFAMIGIGSVVTRDVPPYALVYGSPAKVKGWVNEKGDKMQQLNNDTWIDNEGTIFIVKNNKLLKQ
jgi:acetyltransferase-like isoleucine patch superfamily enzyme